MHSDPQVRAGWSDTRADEYTGIAVSTVSVKNDRTVEKFASFKRWHFMLIYVAYFISCLSPVWFLWNQFIFCFISPLFSNCHYFPAPILSCLSFFSFFPLPLFDLLLIEQALGSFLRLKGFIITTQGEIITDLDPLLSVPRTYPYGDF
ncbi:hypothetical protein BO83DRAFT_101638 [Aspergillus eucalypticola CBS 122712]|uniref:Uncharacterized protein n=1 Tax=Aspergillus eucalypticola (strain CBS 122712 / IBT 29274) TaxID=1448314 RepID=A0A317V3R4_ASPEC|nr:uncharacterized protein BO83DRAFT_101638 [Aspergillus eucalypticola CBS 122712]PWY67487.1 hypothetical protein BO83DRAFT_101638 [Aspergillus eucalypticola CBS 122712]